MSRISNERTIIEIESIADAVRPSLDAASWHVHGADCLRGRHRFAGQSYGFSIEILELRFQRKGKLVWHLLVVTERWQGAAHADLRTSRWLKLLAGKTSDVIGWIRTCRPLWQAPSEGSDAGET